MGRISRGIGSAAGSVKRGAGKVWGAVRRVGRFVADEAAERVPRDLGGEPLGAHLDEVTEAAEKRRNAVKFDGGKPHHGDSFDDPRGHKIR
jgi:hypothetical protein